MTNEQCDDCSRAGKGVVGIILIAFVINIFRADLSANRQSSEEKHEFGSGIGSFFSSFLLITLDSIALGIFWSGCLKRMYDESEINANYGNAYAVMATVLLIDIFQLCLNIVLMRVK